MNHTYHKIQSIFKRDPKNNHKTFLIGEYSDPAFKFLAENNWQFAEKLDGTNIRVHWDGEKFIFGGRTNNAQIPAGLMNALIEMFPVSKGEFLQVGDTLYGEGVGAGIQKGGSYMPDGKGQTFILFDIRAANGAWHLQSDVGHTAAYLDVNTAPKIGTGSLAYGLDFVRQGFKSQFGDFTAEGLIARPHNIELLNQFGDRVITKIKHRDFQ